MVRVVLFPGWSGNSPKQNFSLLKEDLEKIPGIKVEIIDYLGIGGPFTKMRTRDSIWKIIRRAEEKYQQIPQDEPIIALGHSLGAIILRLLIERGHKFKLAIFAGGPHMGFLPRFKIMEPLALLFRVKLYFELKPGSDFLKILDPPPRGIYIASANDEKVSLESALPSKTVERFILQCGHDMFPKERDKVPESAIPIVTKIVEEFVKNSQ